MCNTPSIISANSENVIFESANVSKALISHCKTCLIVVIMSTARMTQTLLRHVTIIRYGHANDILIVQQTHIHELHVICTILITFIRIVKHSSFHQQFNI